MAEAQTSEHQHCSAGADISKFRGQACEPVTNPREGAALLAELTGKHLVKPRCGLQSPVLGIAEQSTEGRVWAESE